MTRIQTITLVVVGVIAVAIGGYVAYDQVLRGDSVAPLALPSSSPDTAAEATPEPDPSETASSEPTAAAYPTQAASTGTTDSLAGEWTVGDGSEAGYRVREQLASLSAESDAVGRTSDVSGSATIAADGESIQLTAATIEVDTTTITSDEDRRDNRLRSEGLETEQYPTATFTLSEPVDVPSEALTGSVVDITLTGDLTLHGVTKTVEIPAQAQLADGRISVAGSTTFALADFEIEAPNVGGFIISIADEGALEFLVNLDPA